MRRAAALSLWFAALVSGCGDEVAPSADGLGAPVVAPEPRARPETSLYDAEGVLRESDTVVAGLRLPVGLEPNADLSTERRHVYRSEVAPQHLLRYFGPRLNTLEIEHEGDVVIYRDATPTAVRENAVRLDVTIEPTSAHPSQLTIYERPPPPPEGTTVSEDAIRRHLDTLRPERRE